MQVILRKPLVTEKAMRLAQANEYTFLVDSSATKEAVAKAVADKFNVTVLRVKTINVKGERKVQRRVRKFYQIASFKKAIVQLKKGQSLAVFETPKDGSTSSPKEEAVVTTAESEPQIVKERKGNILSRTKVRVEKGKVGGALTTQRKVIPT